MARPATKNFWKFFFGGGDAAPEASNQLQEKTDNNEADTREILVNLRNLQNLRLDDIAVPKADIIALAEDASFKDVIEVFRSSGFTRVPVFSDTLDNPLGLIHLKDLALSHGFGAKKKFNLKTKTSLFAFVCLFKCGIDAGRGRHCPIAALPTYYPITVLFRFFECQKLTNASVVEIVKPPLTLH